MLEKSLTTSSGPIMDLHGHGCRTVIAPEMEGDAQEDHVKDHAYCNILATKYYEEEKKFSFEMYVTIHQ